MVAESPWSTNWIPGLQTAGPKILRKWSLAHWRPDDQNRLWLLRINTNSSCPPRETCPLFQKASQTIDQSEYAYWAYVWCFYYLLFFFGGGGEGASKRNDLTPSWKKSIVKQIGCHASTMRWFTRQKICLSRFKIPVKRHKWKGKVQRNALFSFCDQRKAFQHEIVLQEILPCLLPHGALGLFWNLTNVVRFLKNFQVFVVLNGHENNVLKKIYIFVNVS